MNILSQNEQSNVAIQGYEGSFHHKAAMAIFGAKMQLTPCDTFARLVKETESNRVIDYAIMAIENSIAGSILPNYQLLRASALYIIGEVYVKIGQHLMALPGQKIEQIKEEHSHHMALKQCEPFLAKYPNIKAIEKEDTAGSAKEIALNNLTGIAAIASEAAAKIHQLEILASNIETVSNNFTRFLVLSKNPTESSTLNKASLLLSLKHESGSLSKVLNLIASYGYNISKIQSFPIIEEEWQYYFIVDLEAPSLAQFDELVETLAAYVTKLRVLGKYIKGITV